MWHARKQNYSGDVMCTGPIECAGPPPLRPRSIQEPIDLADSSDEEEGDESGDAEQRVNSGKAAGPGPSSAPAAAVGPSGAAAVAAPSGFRSLSIKLAGLKCCYPPEGGKHSVEVTAEDLARLEKGEFLNDTCIDFYLK
jgi:Ulp1 family protease